MRVALAADGRRLLSLEQSGTVRGWDVETGAELPLEAARKFPELEIASAGMGFDNKSHFLIVPVRTEAADESVGRFGGLGRSTNAVPTGDDPCAFSADLNWMLAVRRDGRAVDLYHVASARRVRGYGSGETPVTRICFSKSGGQFYAALDTGEILVRDLRTGLVVRRVPAATSFQGTVPPVALSPSRDTALVLSADGSVKTWDVQQGKEIGQWQFKRLAGQPVATQVFVTGASTSGNGRALLATLSNGETVVADATTGDEFFAVAAPSGSQPGGTMGMGGTAMGMGGAFGIGRAGASPVISSNHRRVVAVESSGGQNSIHVWELPEVAALVRTGEQAPSAAPSLDLAFGTRTVPADANASAAAPFLKARRAATESPQGFSAIAIGRSGRRGWGTGAMPGENGALVALHQFDTSTGAIENSVPLATEVEATFSHLTVSRDEGRVAVATAGGAVMVIDTVARQVLSRIAPAGATPASPDTVRSVSFFRDGTLMVVVHDTAVSVHRTDSGDVVRRVSLQERQGRSAPAAGGAMARVFVPDRQLQQPPNAFFSAALSSDAKKLTVMTADGGLMSYDMDTGRQTADFRCQSPSTVAFTADGQMLFVGATDVSPSETGQQPAVGFLYDVATGSQLANLHDAELDLIVGSDFSEDGNWLVTGHASGRCQRWSALTGQKTGFSSLSDIEAGGITQAAEGSTAGGEIDRMPFAPTLPNSRRSPRAALLADESARALVSLTVLDDAAQFWSVNRGEVMALWNVKRESSAAKAVFAETDAKPIAQRGTLSGIEGFPVTLAISPDSKRCLAATDQGDLTLWDLPSFSIGRQMKGAAPAVSSTLSFSPDSKGAAFATVHRGPLFLNLINFSVTVPGEKAVVSGKPASGQPAPKPSTKSAKAAKKTKRPPNDGLTMPSLDGQPLDEATYAPAQAYTGSGVLSVAVCPDGRFLLCGHQDGSVTRLDRTSGVSKPVGKRPNPVFKVGASNSSQRLMAYDGESVVQWEATTGNVVHQVKVPATAPGCLEFSADGRLAVVWDELQREVVVLDIEQGTEKHRIALSKGEEGQLPFAVSSDGRWLLAGSPSNRVKTVLAEGQPVEGSPRNELLSGGVVVEPPRAKAEALLKVAVKHFDPTAGSTDVKLWSLETGKVVAILKGHAEAVVAVSLSSDGKTAVTAGLDQTVRVWSLP